jgi:hypothetical protein
VEDVDLKYGFYDKKSNIWFRWHFNTLG